MKKKRFGKVMKNKKKPKEKAELWSSVKRDAKSSIQKKIQ